MDKLIILQGISLDNLLERIDEIVQERLKEVLVKIEPPAKTKYLARIEVGKLLKITLPTLHDWTKLGLLKSYKIGSRVLYKENEIEEAIQGPNISRHRKGRR